MNSEFKDWYHGGFTHAKHNLAEEVIKNCENVVHVDTDMCLYEYVLPTTTFKLSPSETKYLESDTAAVRDKALECWIRWLAKEMGKEVTDEYVQYCIDSWHETMKLLG